MKIFIASISILVCCLQVAAQQKKLITSITTNGLAGCNCDSIAHLKDPIDPAILGSGFREASECEMLFDKAVGKIVSNAFQSIRPMQSWSDENSNDQINEWFYKSWPKEFLLVDNTVSENIHKRIFWRHFLGEAGDDYRMQMAESDKNKIAEADMIEVNKRVAAEFTQADDNALKQAYKDEPSKYEQKKNEAKEQLFSGAISQLYLHDVTIYVAFNQSYDDELSFTTSYKAINIPGAVAAFQSADASFQHQGNSPYTIVYFGDFKKPLPATSSKNADGTIYYEVKVPTTLPKNNTPKLALYNMKVVIKAAPSTVNKFIAKINWEVLVDAIHKKIVCDK